MSELRLSWAEVALINLSAALLVMPVSEAKDIELYLAQIAGVLPRCTADQLRLRDLAAAMRALIEARADRHHPDPDRRAPWHKARFDGCMALEAVMRWRAGEALAHLETAKAAEGAR